MRKSTTLYRGQPQLSAKPFVSFALLAALWLLTACFLPPALPTQLPQPTSPLIPGQNSLLADKRWQVVAITQQQAAVTFDAVGPIYIIFHKNGQLEFNAPACSSGGYQIMAESERRYRLVGAGATARDCGERKNKQLNAVLQAISATTAYELQDKRLFLTGPDVRIVLEIDNTR